MGSLLSLLPESLSPALLALLSSSALLIRTQRSWGRHGGMKSGLELVRFSDSLALGSESEQVGWGT